MAIWRSLFVASHAMCAKVCLFYGIPKLTHRNKKHFMLKKKLLWTMEFQSGQNCVTEINNVLCWKHTKALWYGTNGNIMLKTEIFCSKHRVVVYRMQRCVLLKCRNVMLKTHRCHANYGDIMWKIQRGHAQNAEILCKVCQVSAFWAWRLHSSVKFLSFWAWSLCILGMSLYFENYVSIFSMHVCIFSMSL